MIEAFRPGVAERLGVGYEQAKAVNPGIVYCSMSAWGQDGPYVHKPAHDLACEAIAGILSINQGSDGKPAIPGIAGADMLSSMMTLSALLMALLRRKDTGEGDYIDVAMADSLIAAIPNNMGTTFADKQPPILAEERALGGYAMYQIYETRDRRHIALGGSEYHFAEAIVTKLGRPDLLDACKTPPGLGQEEGKLFLTDRFKEHDQSYWVEFFEGVNAAFAPVKNLREAADDIRASPSGGHEGIAPPSSEVDQKSKRSSLGFSMADLRSGAGDVPSSRARADLEPAGLRNLREHVSEE